MYTCQTGDRVVCVNDYWPMRSGSSPLKSGTIYTIQALKLCTGAYTLPDGSTLQGEIVVVILKGVANPDSMSDGFHPSRFKPLSSKGIEIFRKIARDVTDEKKLPLNCRKKADA